MTEFFADYGLFLLKTVTIVLALIAVIIAIAAASKKAGEQDGLAIENLNDSFRKRAQALKQQLLSKSSWKKLAKRQKSEDKAREKSDEARPRAFVIDFKGDLKATAVASLREEVSAVLAVAESSDQVIVRLENYGGVVHEHGLGASQLVRLRDHNVPLTVSVDKVAASGGYLMACVANHVVAAPFAILGSIGVIAQLPNFNRLMDERGIDYEQITAGKHKRNVTMFGKNTDEDRAKLKEELEEVHSLFKGAVARYRPDLDLDQVATGEHWYGTQALELGLADELKTSDEILATLAETHDLYRVEYKIRQPLQKRLLGGADAMLERLDASGWRQRFESRLPR